MLFVRTPVDEARRLATLHRLGLLDTAPDARFDTLASAAALLTGCPAAGIGLIDASRQWFKAAHGMARTAVPRDNSLCALTLLGAGVHEVSDTPLADDPTAALLAQQAPLSAPLQGLPVRFYAGVALHVGGLPIGTLFVQDVQARSLSPSQKEALVQLASVVAALAGQHSEPQGTERNRLLDFARASGDWMWETDAELRYTWVSGAFEAVTGLPPHSVYGQRIANSPLLDSLGRPLAVGHLFHDLLRQREPITRVITEKVTAHGALQISRSAVPVFNNEGNFAGYRGTARDVTEHITRERQAHGQAALLRKLSSQVPGVIFQLRLLPNHTVHYLFASDACREMFGAEPPHDGDGGDPQAACKALHPDDEPGFLKSLIEAGHHMRTWHREVRTLRDGQVRWIDVRAVPTRHPEQGLLWHGFAADVTASKETELALRSSEQRWNMAAKAAGIGIALVDLASGQITMDEIACANHGLPHPLGPYTLSAWLQSIVEEDRPAAEHEVQRALATQSTVEARYRVTRPDGSTPTLEIFAHGISGNDGQLTGILGACRDVTQQIAHEQLRHDKESAERASRAKTEFLSRVSHELRTPLNGILGFAQLMALDRVHALAPEQSRRLDSVLHAGRHLLDLINDVLNLARIEQEDFSLQLVAVDLSATIASCLAMVQPLANSAGVQLVAHAATPVWVRADARAVEQVLINLLSNAIKYNCTEGHVFVGLTREAEQVHLSVRDEGQGLSSAQQQHLFEPFNRLGAEQQRVEGTGLGLVIARALAIAMGGTLSVQSPNRSGATFTLTLPPCTAPECQPPASAQTLAAQAQPSPARKTVLYIEDEPLNQLLMQELFRPHPQWQLSVVGDGAAGLAWLHQQLPDLLLIDMNLPDTHGLALIELLRSNPRTAALHCIALSADAMQSQIDTALAAGFNAYWTKPIHVARVLEGLTLALAAPNTP